MGCFAFESPRVRRLASDIKNRAAPVSVTTLRQYTRLAALVVVLLAGCSGSPWFQRVDSPAGLTISYDETVFRDIEHVLLTCANPVVIEAGAGRFTGSINLLPGCQSASGLNFERIEAGHVAPNRVNAVAIAMTFINVPIDPPVLSVISVRNRNWSISNVSWVIPLIENGLRNTREIPAQVREGFMATVRAILDEQDCRLESRTAVRFRQLRLRNIGMSWQRATLGGARLLRMTAEIGSSNPLAEADVSSQISCGGSTHNLANELLNAMLPDATLDIRLRNASLQADFELHVRSGEPGDRGRLVVTSRRSIVEVGSIEVERFNSPAADFLLDQAIADMDITPASVGMRIEDALRDPLSAATTPLADMLLASLDIDDSATETRRLSLSAVEVDTTQGMGNHRMRFEAMRTDQICNFRPGGRVIDGRFVPGEGEWICRDGTPIQQPSNNRQCYMINGRRVCIESPRP
ncbi:hypothetical protein YTPLAS72_23520 [Nitrospira sp.]|nr:hypothetical protein YTPLAS72_23520 [Nitrospira sp.]